MRPVPATSREHVQAVLDDGWAAALFQGQIHRWAGRQKTDARMPPTRCC